MKKILFFATIAIAIASFGIHSSLAHAQTVPSGTASDPVVLQQQLDMMKATLVNLQMKAGIIPQGDASLPGGTAPAASVGTSAAPTPVTTGLSVSDRATLSSALSSLISALSSLNATLAANPSAATTHQAAISSVLNGMQGTLVAMNNAIANGGSAPVVAGAPSGSGAGAPIAQTQPSTNSNQPGTGSLAPSANSAGANSSQQTAQASNAWDFVVRHWPTITIVILVALILLILFWPSKEDERGKDHGAPIKSVSPNRPLASTSATQNPSRPQVSTSTPAATPMAVTVNAPSAKVTVVRLQNQQQSPQKTA